MLRSLSAGSSCHPAALDHPQFEEPRHHDNALHALLRELSNSRVHGHPCGEPRQQAHNSASCSSPFRRSGGKKKGLQLLLPATDAARQSRATSSDVPNPAALSASVSSLPRLGPWQNPGSSKRFLDTIFRVAAETIMVRPRGAGSTKVHPSCGAGLAAATAARRPQPIPRESAAVPHHLAPRSSAPEPAHRRAEETLPHLFANLTERREARRCSQLDGGFPRCMSL